MGNLCFRSAYQAIETPKLEASQNDANVVNMKFVVFGQQGVGKSTLVRVLSGLPCLKTPIPTQGLEHTVVRWRIMDVELRVALWDTPGESAFYENLTNTSRDILTHSVDGAVLLFDSFKKESIEYIFQKIAEMQEFYGTHLSYALIGSRKRFRKAVKEDQSISSLGEEGRQYHVIDLHDTDAYESVLAALTPLVLEILQKKTAAK